MHWLGNQGMPRRYVDYQPGDNFTVLHSISTIGAFLLGLSVLPFLYNVIRSYRYGEPAGADDPWGYGNSLEWATTCPPPRHNFTELPQIRSERPAFELHYPDMIERFRNESRQYPHRAEERRASPLEKAAATTQPDEQGDNTDPRDK
jgi:cytochrome c oxidase subunit 1